MLCCSRSYVPQARVVKVACRSAHDEVPKALERLDKKRRQLESQRARQLGKIVKALDEVARQEVSFLSKPAAEDKVHNDEIPVEFVARPSDPDSGNLDT